MLTATPRPLTILYYSTNCVEGQIARRLPGADFARGREAKDNPFGIPVACFLLSDRGVPIVVR
jgi:hypothetical protein